MNLRTANYSSMHQAVCGAFLPDLAPRRFTTNPLPTVLLQQRLPAMIWQIGDSEQLCSLEA